jgi:hypothetical protein
MSKAGGQGNGLAHQDSTNEDAAAQNENGGFEYHIMARNLSASFDLGHFGAFMEKKEKRE